MDQMIKQKRHERKGHEIEEWDMLDGANDSWLGVNTMSKEI